MPADHVHEIMHKCYAVRLRRLHRALTSLYDEAFRPYGLRVGQLNLLVGIACHDSVRPADLARALNMDKSTLSRDLEILNAKGWVLSLPGEDARSQHLHVTESGLKLIETITPAWRMAQEKAAELMGEEGTKAIFTAADRL